MLICRHVETEYYQDSIQWKVEVALEPGSLEGAGKEGEESLVHILSALRMHVSNCSIKFYLHP